MSASSEVAFLARALKAPRVAELAAPLAEQARLNRAYEERFGIPADKATTPPR